MKQAFEHMITEIVLVTALFVISTFTLIDLQVLNARRIHTAAVEQIQASYYTVDINEMNEKLHEQHPKWILGVEEVNTYNTRKEYRVTLVYQVAVPIFNITRPGIIEGFAR